MKEQRRQSGSLTNSKDEQELCALMRRAQTGDGDSYNSLLTRIEKMLQNFVRKSVTQDSTEDVIQEIILAVHEKRNTFNTEQFFLPWLYAIARYKVVDYIRLRARKEVLAFDPEGFEQLLVSDVSGVMDSVTVDDLDGILLNLPKKQREIVTSVKIDGLSIKETAQKLGLSESDIKINIHRALKTLKIMFSGGPPMKTRDLIDQLSKNPHPVKPLPGIKKRMISLLSVMILGSGVIFAFYSKRPDLREALFRSQFFIGALVLLVSWVALTYSVSILQLPTIENKKYLSVGGALVFVLALGYLIKGVASSQLTGGLFDRWHSVQSPYSFIECDTVYPSLFNFTQISTHSILIRGSKYRVMLCNFGNISTSVFLPQ